MNKNYCQTHRVNESEAAVHRGERELGIQMHPSTRCRRRLFTICWRALLLSTSLASVSGEVSAQHPAHCEEENLQPILSNGDFDGDGTVTEFDVRLISDRVGSGEYVAFFDLNADGLLNGQDVSLTARAIGDSSTLLDQQFATVFWSTERYRDVNNAITDGYRPFTPILEGHGMHYAKLPFLATPSGLDPDYENILDGQANVHEPEGLNYDENGNLVAVFYYHGIDEATHDRSKNGGEGRNLDLPGLEDLPELDGRARPKERVKKTREERRKAIDKWSRDGAAEAVKEFQSRFPTEQFPEERFPLFSSPEMQKLLWDEDADDKLRSLRKKRCRLALVECNARMSEYGMGRAHIAPVLDASRRLASSLMALEPDSSTRLTILRHDLAVTQELEHYADLSLESGTGTRQDLAFAAYERIGAEIRLQQERERQQKQDSNVVD